MIVDLDVVEELRRDILAYVNKVGGGVSFAELQQELGERTVGELEMGMFDQNLIFWQCVSPEFTEALNQLFRSKVIKQSPTNVLVYFTDGAVLKLPLAVKIPAGGYKKPHWVPVVLDMG
jgi:hypothetical protein